MGIVRDREDTEFRACWLRTGYLVLGFGEVGCFVNNNGTQKYVEKELRHFIAFLLAFEFIIFSCLFIHSFICLWDIYIYNLTLV